VNVPNLDVWFNIAERRTSKDQVYDILHDWKHDRERMESIKQDLLTACRVAFDALGCDRLALDRLEAQRIIKAAIDRADTKGRE